MTPAKIPLPTAATDVPTNTQTAEPGPTRRAQLTYQRPQPFRPAGDFDQEVRGPTEARARLSALSQVSISSGDPPVAPSPWYPLQPAPV